MASKAVSEAAIAGLLGRFKELKKEAERILSMSHDILERCRDAKTNEELMNCRTRAGTLISSFDPEIKSLIRNYNEAANSLLSLFSDEPYSALPHSFPYDTVPSIGVLQEIVVNCGGAIEFLETQLKQPKLSFEELDKLKSLRKEVEDRIDCNIALREHLLQAVEEYERGHYLACALIAGKVVDYLIDRLASMFGVKEKEISEKARLVAEKISEKLKIEKSSEKWKFFVEDAMKTAKHARNYFTHDLSSIPTRPADVLSLLSGAVALSVSFCRIQRRNTSKM